MWCENCKKSFETEEKLCPECGKELIDYTPILDEDTDLSGINEIPDALEGEETTEEVQIDIEATSQLLVTVIGEKEAKRIISILNENNIPAFEKIADEQSLDDLDGIEWDEEDFEDEFEDEEYETESLTPPETEDELLLPEEILYDIFVPETQFPEAMTLMLEKDKDRDATIIDDLAEIIPDDADFEESFEVEEKEIITEEDDFEEITQEMEEVTEETEKVEGEKTKGGFWNLFRK